MAQAGVVKEEGKGRTDAARKQECALKKGEEVVGGKRLGAPPAASCRGHPAVCSGKVEVSRTR